MHQKPAGIEACDDLGHKPRKLTDAHVDAGHAFRRDFGDPLQEARLPDCLADWKDIRLLPFWKFVSDSTLLVVFELTSMGNPPSAPPTVKVIIDGGLSKVVEGQSVNFNGIYGAYSTLISISGLNTTSIHEIHVQGLN